MSLDRVRRHPMTHFLLNLTIAFDDDERYPGSYPFGDGRPRPGLHDVILSPIGLVQVLQPGRSVKHGVRFTNNVSRHKLDIIGRVTLEYILTISISRGMVSARIPLTITMSAPSMRYRRGGKHATGGRQMFRLSSAGVLKSQSPTPDCPRPGQQDVHLGSARSRRPSAFDRSFARLPAA